MFKTHAKMRPSLNPAAQAQSQTQDGAHFANVVPHGLPWLWVHAKHNVRHFVRDYALAVSLTVIFLVLVIVASWIRFSQRASLANLLATASSVTQDITSLVSGDKSTAPARSDVQDETAQAPEGSSASFAINASGSSPGQTAGSNGSSGGGTPTVAPFSASIASFRQDNVSLECSKPVPKRQFCSKRYSFSATVNTKNGPGSVNYGWRSNVVGANQDGSYAAASGVSQQTLQKSVTISCLTDGSYSMQFVIISPTQVQSPTLAITHDCSAI